MRSLTPLVHRPGAYSEREVLADRVIHAVGMVAGLAAAPALIAITAARHDPGRLLAVTIYAAGLLAMLACSAAYSLAPSPSPRRGLLRRLDHAAIFLMIAGTYTPFMAEALGGRLGFLLLTAVWAMTLCGVAMKLALPLRFEVLSITLYLAQGWIVLTALHPLLDAVSQPTFILLATGGAIYTAGIVFYAFEAMPFHKPIWHALVLAGATCHYEAVLQGVALVPPT